MSFLAIALMAFVALSEVANAQNSATTGSPAAPQAINPGTTGAPLVTQFYCDSSFGCKYCWGSQCPSGQTLSQSLQACQSSCAASAPKWYCAPCETDASQSCCWVCREYGCPASLGSTYTNLQDCMASSQCSSNYKSYLGGQSSRK